MKLIEKFLKKKYIEKILIIGVRIRVRIIILVVEMEYFNNWFSDWYI